MHFFSLNTYKYFGYDKVSFNVTYKPLLHIFNLSIEKRIFPNDLKIARVIRPISVLLCFSKLLHKITYNRPYKLLTFNDILYEKKFGFKEGHLTEHSLVERTDQINNILEKSLSLDIFIELAKVFDTVVFFHQILISKLQSYGVNGSNLRWNESYQKTQNNFLYLIKTPRPLQT